MWSEDTYYQAMLARDSRFDGKFFVGVKTTGIYCRPICPAKPLWRNVEFFASRLEAEKAGYRPCMRCRPESAPLSPVWIGTSAVVRRAVRVLHGREAMELKEEEFAQKFGMSARHLRRLFMDELGKTPKQISFENRLNLARTLLVESSLPIGEVAHAAGFQSIRRFNDAFLVRFKKSPRQIRRSTKIMEALVIPLSYRPPFDFAGLLHSYRRHRVGKLENVGEDFLHRWFELGGKIGSVCITDQPERSRILVKIDFPDLTFLPAILERVRNMFDLSCDPVLVANSLEVSASLKKILAKFPGIRIPSGWDPFEICVATILGQLVSVEQGQALVEALMEKLGEERELRGQKLHLFPSAEKISQSDLSFLRTTGARKKTLLEFSRQVAAGELSLEPTQDTENFVQRVQEISGIGPWSASYMALKALRHPDQFPHTDLILQRALKIHGKETIGKMSPWRGYGAALLWRDSGSRKGAKNEYAAKKD